MPRPHPFFEKTRVNDSGHLVVDNLFESFDFETLPDNVHEPTYKRLCAFAEEELRWTAFTPPRLTMREIVKAIKVFNTSIMCERHREMAQDGTER